MPKETRYILTPKGRRLRSLGPYEETSENLEMLVRQADLGIVVWLMQEGSMTLEELEGELVRDYDYKDPYTGQRKVVQTTPSDVRLGLRRLFEGGYIERVD